MERKSRRVRFEGDETSARESWHLDETYPERALARERFDVVEENLESRAAERTVEEERARAFDEGDDFVRLTAEKIEPGEAVTIRERARRAREVRLNFETDDSRAREETKKRSRAPRTGPDVDDAVRRTELESATKARENVDRRGKEGNALPRERARIAEELAHTEKSIEPRVSLEAWHTFVEVAKFLGSDVP
jgi:hypothetical protein